MKPGSLKKPTVKKRLCWAPDLPGETEVHWRTVPRGELAPQEVVILVDEFVEFERAGYAPFTREEFRKVCDGGRTKEEILEALSR